MNRQLNILAPLILCVFALSAQAAQLRIAWDASPTSGVTYVLKAGTNSLVQPFLTPGLTNVNVGTNLQVAIEFPIEGRWYFHVTAVKAGVESLPSNELIIDVPAPPQNTRTLAVEYTPVITGTNWTDVGFFRIKLQ